MLPPASVAASAGSGARLTTVDYRSEARRATVAADGTATVTFDPVGAGFLWLVERITVTCTSTAATKAAAYVGDPVPANLVDGTNSGNLDTADENSPILVDSSVSFTIRWTGGTAGATATARVQYRLVKRG